MHSNLQVNLKSLAAERRRLPSMNSLRAFEAAARLNSIKDAADELCVTPAAVSQQIKKLEDELSMELFDRHHRSIVLTARGRELSECLIGAISDIRATLSKMREAPVESDLTFMTGPSFHSHFVAPRLSDFYEKHPGINVRLVIGTDTRLFTQERVDVGVHLANAEVPNTVSSKCFWEQVLPMGTPGYVERLGIHRAEDLERATILEFDPPYPGYPTWDDWLAHAGVKLGEARRIRYGVHYERVGDALLNDAGIALGTTIVASSYIASSRLVCPVGPPMPTSLGFRVFTRSEADKLSHVARFKSWLLDELETASLRVVGFESVAQAS